MAPLPAETASFKRKMSEPPAQCQIFKPMSDPAITKMYPGEFFDGPTARYAGKTATSPQATFRTKSQKYQAARRIGGIVP
jgi:hypothetical protein